MLPPVKTHTTSQKEKHLIRKKTLNQRLKSDKKELKRQSHEIMRKLLVTRIFQKGKNILFYMPIQNEVDTKPLIEFTMKKNKNVLVPRVENEESMDSYKINSLKDLIVGKFDVLEAKKSCEKFPKKDIDLIIIPGIAFDERGYRIGFGKGYYDNFLKGLRARKIALAYDFQIVKNIPGESHDIKMDVIITPTKTIVPK
ncbi:MAG: 5-formyltetrahydrofolate cyclo-ligase [Candidatus Gracilibacteria bacterium]|jgi:5-formyltetrahydrofolate cyclo-ligase